MKNDFAAWGQAVSTIAPIKRGLKVEYLDPEDYETWGFNHCPD